MKKLILAFSILLLPLLLGGWVDPDTVDVFTGYAVKSDNSYDVSDLSGSIQYYLTGYDGFCLDSNGYLFNSSSTARTGSCRTAAGYETECRFNARSGLQIQQTYYSNGIARTAWISYNLTPDTIPVSWSTTEIMLLVIGALTMVSTCVILVVKMRGTT